MGPTRGLQKPPSGDDRHTSEHPFSVEIAAAERNLGTKEAPDKHTQGVAKPSGNRKQTGALPTLLAISDSAFTAKGKWCFTF